MGSVTALWWLVPIITAKSFQMAQNMGKVTMLQDVLMLYLWSKSLGNAVPSASIMHSCLLRMSLLLH